MSSSKNERDLMRQGSKQSNRRDSDAFDGADGHSRRSPKKSKSKQQIQYDEEEDSEDDYDDEFNNSFINDEEEEDEYDEDEEFGKQKEKKKRHHKKKRDYKIDEDDAELVKENTGMQVKIKQRLKRNADVDNPYNAATNVKESASAAALDAPVSRPVMKAPSPVPPTKRRNPAAVMRTVMAAEDYAYYSERQQIAADKLKQAQDIFGEDDEELELPMADVNLVANVEQDDNDLMDAIDEAHVFDDHEIDDPFSTALDKQIMDTDICERLQVRIKKNRMRPSAEEIQEEAEWIFERLRSHTSLSIDDKQRIDFDHKYEKRFAGNSEAVKEKIRKVLEMLRCKLFDIPMIVKYRGYEYGDELDEDSIWIIYNLDQEYGKFIQQKQQIQDFLQKITAICPQLQVHIDELAHAQLKSHLLNFNSLITYLTSYYKEHINGGMPDTSQAAASSGVAGGSRKKEPLKRDEIQIAKQGRIDQFAKTFTLPWNHFLENLKAKQALHQPPQPESDPYTEAKMYLNEQYPSEEVVRYGVCTFAAIELSAQPYIRNDIKKFVNEHAHMTTELTEQGKKDLDLFHPSYRVKTVRRLPLSDLQNHNDLYLDVIECEKAGLITVNVNVDNDRLVQLKRELIPLYVQAELGEENLWNRMRMNIIATLIDKLLLKELIKELREEIKEKAETFVIAKCKEAYRKLIFMGPFTTKKVDPYYSDRDHRYHGHGDQAHYEEYKGSRPSGTSRDDNQVVKDRERNCVMGAIMHMIDNNNYVVTVAIVDKYGELVQTRDFMRLLPPRKRAPPKDRDGQFMQHGSKMMSSVSGGHLQDAGKNLAQPKTEDELQHEKDKKKLIELLEECQVDLITVAANCLEARYLKSQLKSITDEYRQKSRTGGSNPEESNDHHSSGRDRDRGRSSQGRNEPPVRKDIQTIWGRTEIPKLFSISHNSQKIHKNIQQTHKQAISLARFEQDPLCELLNLWSPITAENQALALNMDPMQKCVNQSKLADGLEEVNIQVVNQIGIDINLAVEHVHMQSMLQFISGFGPRKARKCISKMKKLDLKLKARSDLFTNDLVGPEVLISAHAFMKIRVPEEDIGKANLPLHILDQTRIHLENYKLAMKIVTDASTGDRENSAAGAQLATDRNNQQKLLRDIMANPGKLTSIDLQNYFEELARNNAGTMKKKIVQIIDELSSPFGDPRKYRTEKANIDSEELFYMLIEESKRTFKKGIIVTATVTRPLQSVAICRLDNGLNAIIRSSDFLENTSQEQDWKKKMNQGKIVQGRINSFRLDDENKFEVQLNCKKRDLASHEEYKEDLAKNMGFRPDQILPADLKNHHFSADQRPVNAGRFNPRCIAHEKFKNISSRRAISELSQLQNGEGEFFFRPSTRSEDRITLTWRFWKHGHFVHIDITEIDKQKGAVIGNCLKIGNESYFESLNEIVERYIIPCNRLVREVSSHPKFSDVKTYEELELKLKEEKKDDPARIPYRFAILPNYPQYIVLGYVPKERVVKEFIKVRPRGFYFHEENHAPFQKLINWFKENWRKEKYQHHLRRQRSPSIKVKAPPAEAASIHAEKSTYQQRNWGDAPSIHSHAPAGSDAFIRQEQRAVRSPSYGRPQARGGGNSPSLYGGYSAMQAHWGDPGKQHDAVSAATGYPGTAGGANDESPRRGGYGTLDNSGRTRGRGRGGIGGQAGDCFSCGQPGHKSFQCPNHEGRPRRPMECYRCHQDGHMAKNCATGGAGGGSMADGGSAYKRPRHNDDADDGGYSRSNHVQNAAMLGGQLPTADAWATSTSQANNQAGQHRAEQAKSAEMEEDWNQGAQGSSGWQ